eukprot:scaffold1594_cov401-Prasinococcus_capsulatus_cf.AAC.61
MESLFTSPFISNDPSETPCAFPAECRQLPPSGLHAHTVPLQAYYESDQLTISIWYSFQPAP